jgi:phytoene dehydrogenase-like protein
MLFAFADSPRDIERRFRTTRAGSVRQGTLTREQTFAGRPPRSAAAVAPPSMACTSAAGASTRGIPGSLGGGYNAARVVCSDLGLERWWPDPASVEHAREVGLLPEVRIA